jgi:hypothetical protein
MSQNLLSLQFDAAQLAQVDAALTALENALEGLIALTPEQHRGLVRMGQKSEAFCRQTINVLAQNPQVIPRSTHCARASHACSA